MSPSSYRSAAHGYFLPLQIGGPKTTYFDGWFVIWQTVQLCNASQHLQTIGRVVCIGAEQMQYDVVN